VDGFSADLIVLSINMKEFAADFEAVAMVMATSAMIFVWTLVNTPM
jgi:hypothetical protein